MASAISAPGVLTYTRAIMSPARRFWQRIESIHAVTYFAPESIEAAKNAGLAGFWMGYFGFRAAPLGAVAPGAVEAAFANFSPSMVHRALPDAWARCDPGELVRCRAESAAIVLRRLSPDAESVAGGVVAALRDTADEASPLGKPLFAANRTIAAFDDPVQDLWQLCTTLREQRGDGHVLALAAHGIDGVEAHHLLAADRGVDPTTFFASRGWNEVEQDAGLDRLVARGLVSARGGLTGEGLAVRREVERLTDDLAAVPDSWVVERLDPMARAIASSGVLPFPNPMGLPALEAQV